MTSRARTPARRADVPVERVRVVPTLPSYRALEAWCAARDRWPMLAALRHPRVLSPAHRRRLADECEAVAADLQRAAAALREREP